MTSRRQVCSDRRDDGRLDDATFAGEEEEAGEDLRAPCDVEVAVFTAFSGSCRRRVRASSSSTPPQPTTLLLLDVTEPYHRQVIGTDPDAEQAVAGIVTPVMRLRDPDDTKILLVRFVVAVVPRVIPPT